MLQRRKRMAFDFLKLGFGYWRWEAGEIKWLDTAPGLWRPISDIPPNTEMRERHPRLYMTPDYGIYNFNERQDIKSWHRLDSESGEFCMKHMPDDVRSRTGKYDEMSWEQIVYVIIEGGTGLRYVGGHGIAAYEGMHELRTWMEMRDWDIRSGAYRVDRNRALSFRRRANSIGYWQRARRQRRLLGLD